MKGGKKIIKGASNQCFLCTDCINKNVKHEVIKYWKIQDLKKGTQQAKLQVTKTLLGICISVARLGIF